MTCEKQARVTVNSTHILHGEEAKSKHRFTVISLDCERRDD